MQTPDELTAILTVICDRLEALADQNEEAAVTISAIRETLKKDPGLQAEYERLSSKFRGLATSRTADVALQGIRQQLSQWSRPKA